MNTLMVPEVQAVLERLHALAESRDDSIIQQVRGLGSTWDSATSEQRATLLRDALLFLDGWKEIYLDVLKLVLPNLLPGAVVLADDVNLFPDHVAAYLEYMRDPANGFLSVTLPLGDGIEYSVRV